VKTNRAKLIWISLGIFLAVFGYFAVRAHLKIVTLHVQNADVRDVIRKIQWQIWEPILVNREVRGRVTLQVRNAHLEDVLGLIEQQTGGRWTLMYPLYSTRKNVTDFKKAVRGEVRLERSNWTNLVRMLMDDRPQIRTGARMASQVAPVSLRVTNCELRLVLLALSRFGNVSIVPMNGMDGKLSLQLEQASVKKAVKRTAQGLHRKWTSYYALLAPMMGPPDLADQGPDAQGPFSPNGPPPPPPNEGDGGLPPPPPGDGFMPPKPPPTKEQEQQRESDYKALTSMLPPAQRAQMEMERRMAEALKSKPPEEHQQIINQVTGQSTETVSNENEKRNKGLLTTTPQQRVAIDRAGAPASNAGDVQQKRNR